MKAQMKAIMASAVVIALCLAAVGGVTYSWFSDSQESEIQVDTAIVDLKIEFGTPSDNSTITDIMGSGNTFTLQNLAANFHGFVPMTTNSNLSNIDTAFRQSITVTIANPTEEQELLTNYDAHNILVNGVSLYEMGVKADGNDDTPIAAGSYTYNSEWEEIPYGTTSLPIEKITFDTPATYGDDKPSDWANKSKSFKVTINFQIYQGDILSSYSSEVPTTGEVSGTVKVNGNTLQISTTLADGAYTEGDTLTVIASEGTGDSGFSIEGTPYIINLEKTTPISTGYAEVTVSIPADSEPTAVSVVYIGEGEGGNPEITSWSYNDGALTVTFKTTHFSPFLITTDAIEVDSEEELKKAMSSNNHVRLGADITIASSYLDIMGTIDLGDHTINAGNHVIWVDGVDATLSSGKITSNTYNKSCIAIQNGGHLTINGTKITNTNEWGYGICVVGKDSTRSGNDELTLNDATITSALGTVNAYEKTTVTINGGTYTGTRGSVLITNGTQGWNGQTWNINNANIVSNFTGGEDPGYIAVGIQCHNGDTWNISNCTFTITDGVGISVRGGNVTIDNCNFNITNTSNPLIGAIQNTDNYHDIKAGNAIVVTYKDGSYGCSNKAGDVSLTIEGQSYNSYLHNATSYYPLEVTPSTE